VWGTGLDHEDSGAAVLVAPAHDVRVERWACSVCSKVGFVPICPRCGQAARRPTVPSNGMPRSLRAGHEARDRNYVWGLPVYGMTVAYDWTSFAEPVVTTAQMASSIRRAVGSPLVGASLTRKSAWDLARCVQAFHLRSTVS